MPRGTHTIAQGLAASVAMAVLHWLALPPRGISIAGVVAFAPILAHLSNVRGLGTVVAWAVGAYGLTVLLNCAWLVSTLTSFLSFGTAEGIAVLLGFSLLEGGRFGLSVGLARLVTGQPGLGNGSTTEIAALAGAMVIVDAIYPQLFPWPLGVPLVGSLPFMQAVSFVGPSSLTLFVALGSGALAAVLRCRENARFAAAAAGGLVVLGFILGLMRLHRAPPSTTADEPTLRVGLVQGGTPPLEKRANPRAVVTRHVNLTQELLRREPEVDLVVWSETAVAQPIEVNRWPSVLRRRLGFVVKSPILVGATLASTGADGSSRRHNSAVVLTQQSAPCARCRYDKQRLVPFAETKRIFGRQVGRLSTWGGDLSASEMQQPLEISGVRLATYICYEALDAELVRRRVQAARPADVLVNITNDGWFGDSAGRALHFALGNLRAVEQGRYLVRVAETGISGVVDPWGRVVSRIETNLSGSAIANVPLVKHLTPFALAGTAPLVACAVSALASMMLYRRCR